MTNINDALLRGVSMLNRAREENTVPERSTSIVIMLTDGDANTGEAGGVALSQDHRAWLLLLALWPACCETLGGSPQDPSQAVSPLRARPRLPLPGLPTLGPKKGSWPGCYQLCTRRSQISSDRAGPDSRGGCG